MLRMEHLCSIRAVFGWGFQGRPTEHQPNRHQQKQPAIYLFYALEIVLSVEVSALLAIAVIGSWRFGRLALGIRLHQVSKVEAAYSQRRLHSFKTARSAKRYRRAYSPAAASNLAAATRCWYEHDEGEVSDESRGGKAFV